MRRSFERIVTGLVAVGVVEPFEVVEIAEPTQ